LLPPALAVAEEMEVSGREFITAFVAGFEVLHRIGDAAREKSEKLGFHAPGVTGPFGAAIVAGRLLNLNAGQMTNALGIAGSLSSGLLEFAKSGGGTVKRLHLGHGTQSGVMAAMLARDGFAGPATILEGKSETSLNDRAIRELCRKVKLELREHTPAKNLLGSRVTVHLKDGRELVEEMEHFPGAPEQPLDRTGLREKFETTAGLRQNRPAALFDSIATLERASNVGALSWSF
jgi:2-methylcitrate dehydratase PrpD